MRRVWIPAAVAVALGAFLRLAGLDLVWTITDQTRDLLRAFEIARGSAFPLLGPAVGPSAFCLGPLYYYLLAVPAFVAGEPGSVFLFVVLVNVAALAACFVAVRRWLGGRVAVLSLFPYAFSAPWIIRAQVLSNPTLMPLFVVLFWACATEWVVGRRASALPWALACLAALLQLHLSTAVFLPLLLVLWLLFRPPLAGRGGAWGIAAAAALCLPYLWHECLNGWANTLGLLDFIRGAVPAGGGGGAGGVVSDLCLWLTAGPRFLSELAPGASAWYRVFLTENLLAAGGAAAACAYVVTRIARRSVTREARVCAVLLVWLLGTVAAALGRRGGIWLYYLDAAYPAPFVFMGIFLAAVWGEGKGAGGAKGGFAAAARAAVVLYLVLLGALNVTVLCRFRAETARRGTASLPSFWLNIRSMRAWPRERFRFLSVMPQRYRRELAELFVARERLSYGECARRIHGPYAECFREDKGFWIGWMEGEPGSAPESVVGQTGDADGPDAAVRRGGEARRSGRVKTADRAGADAGEIHYLIEGPDTPLVPAPEAAWIPAGPFRIAAFRPAMRVRALEARSAAGAPLGSLEIPTGGAGFAFPGRSPVYRYWEPAFRPAVRSVVLEGEAEVGEGAEAVALCIAVRSAAAVRVGDVLLDGAPVPLRSARRLKMLTLVNEFTGTVRECPPPGRRRLRFTLSSDAPLACDVDVYAYPAAAQ